jgi:hypothetical protein
VFSVTVFEKASIESVIFQTADGSAYVTGKRGNTVGGTAGQAYRVRPLT